MLTNPTADTDLNQHDVMQHAMTTNCYQPTDAENLKYEGSIHPYAATMTELLQQL